MKPRLAISFSRASITSGGGGRWDDKSIPDTAAPMGSSGRIVAPAFSIVSTRDGSRGETLDDGDGDDDGDDGVPGTRLF